MTWVRIAVASTPLTHTLEAAIQALVAAIEEAGRLGAAIVCLPETALPGHRDQAAAVADITADELEAALDEVAAAARRAGVAAIVGAELPTPAGREIVAVVIGADGSRIGVQSKTQIDPSEGRWYVPGSGRRTFLIDELTFGVAICHEAYRYPEITRWLVLAGAQVVFVPHYVVTDDGSLPSRWCDAANPYNEKSLLVRALENSVYIAAANVAARDQGSITGIIDPDGRLIASLPYGQEGVVACDIDLGRADRRMALRWAPDRSLSAPS